MSSSFFRLIVDDLHFILEIHGRFVWINRSHHFIQISNRIIIFKFCIFYHSFHLWLIQRKDNRLIHLFDSFGNRLLPLLEFLVFFFEMHTIWFYFSYWKCFILIDLMLYLINLSHEIGLQSFWVLLHLEEAASCLIQAIIEIIDDFFQVIKSVCCLFKRW